MIHIVEGDLLQGDCNVIAHQCNCFGNWDCGLARQVRLLYPEAYRADQILKASPEERFGQISVGVTNDRRMMIFNLYGQYQFGPAGTCYTDYEKFETALKKMMDWVFRIARARRDLSNVKLGMPQHIGCGHGGGDWDTVLPIIEQVSRQYNRDIFLYSHQGGSVK